MKIRNGLVADLRVWATVQPEAADAIEALQAEIERLNECCTLRGARMQKLYELLRASMTNEHIDASDWHLVVSWFDVDGVPIDAAKEEE